jgi:hypothetical protein
MDRTATRRVARSNHGSENRALGVFHRWNIGGSWDVIRPDFGRTMVDVPISSRGIGFGRAIFTIDCFWKRIGRINDHAFGVVLDA